MPLEHSAHRRGDGACLLRDNDHHCVGVLAHTDAGAVAHAQVPAQVGVTRQGKHTACSHDPAVPDDDRSIVERRFVPKQVFQQLTGHGAVQSGARLDHVVQQIFSLKDHQRPHLVLGHGGVGIYGLGDGSIHVVKGQGPGRGKYVGKLSAAHPLQSLAQLRLEQDDQHQNAPLHHLVQQIARGRQPEAVSQAKRQNQHHDASQHPPGAGFAHQPQGLIDDQGEDSHIDKILHLDGAQQRDLLLEEAEYGLQQH